MSRALRIRAVAVRQLTDSWRTPANNNDVLLWPFIDTLLFGSLGVYLAQQTHGQIRLSWLLTGLVFYHCVYEGCVGVSLGFMNETGDRNLLNLVATPLTPLDYIVGTMLWALLRIAIGLSIVCGFAWLLFSYNVFQGGLGLFVVAPEMILVGLSASLILIGLQLRLGKSAEPFTWVIAVLIPTLSGAFYPVKALPLFVRPLASVLPTTYGFRAGRALYNGGAFPWHNVLMAALGTVVVACVGVLFLTRMLHTFRARGLVTRYS